MASVPWLMKKLARRIPCSGVAFGVIAQVEKNLARLSGGLDLGGDLIDAGRGQHAGLEIENAGVLILLLAQRGRAQ